MKLASNSLQSGKRVRFSGHVHFFKTKKQCAFLSVIVLKIVTLARNSLQIGKTVRFSLKLSKTLFSGHAQHFLAKLHFWASKFLKSSPWPQILFKTGKQCVFNENYTKRSFQVIRSTFCQIAFWSVKVLKIVTLAWNSLQKGKIVRFPWKLTKSAFQVMRSTFWPNLIFECQSSQNRETSLKFSLKRKNSGLFRSCAFLQNRKTVRIFERQSS